MKRAEATALVLFLVAVVPRLAVALLLTGEPVWDGHYYDFGAKRIAAGLGYSDDIVVGGHSVWHPWCHYPVGYSAFLSVFYRIVGAGPRVGPIVGAFVGALLAVVTWALARHALTERRARIAGALVALHPGLVFYSALVMTEPLAALLTLGAFWVYVETRARGRRHAALIAGGLVLGLATLVRPQALLCAPFMGLMEMRGQGLPRARSALVGVAIAVGVTLLPVLPWTARNCRVMDGCALVSTNAGWNLAIGSFPRATGRFETLRSSDGCREVTGQVQQDRCWFDYGIAQIKRAPAFWLSLVPKKLSFTFDHESFAVEYLREARPADWPEARRTMVRGALTTFHRLLVCAAALGCVAFVRRGRAALVQGGLIAVVTVLAYDAAMTDSARFWPLVVFASIVPWVPVPGRPPFGPALLLPLALLGTTLLTHAVFFGEDRYHVVVSPVLCLLAAAALRRPDKTEAPAGR